MDEHRFHIRDERHEVDSTSTERFDRIAFTMRMLGMIRPRMTVAVYPRMRSLAVDRASDRPGLDWATLGVPPDASREHIALAVAELAGVAQPSLLLDLALALPSSDPAE